MDDYIEIPDHIEIPLEQLATQTLQAVIEDFITREGTDYGMQEYSLDQKVAQVHQQLRLGNAIIAYDTQTESCTVLPKDKGLTANRGR